jgi:hypothetical protein
MLQQFKLVLVDFIMKQIIYHSQNVYGLEKYRVTQL